MRKNLQGLLACFVCMIGSMTSGLAQERCGSMPLMENTFKRNPSLRSAFQLQTQHVKEAFLKRKALAQVLRVEGSPIYIPVVFHIVLQNPLLVTDAQIQAQIDRLNIDYAGLNADSSLIPAWFKPFFSKPIFQFKLAQRNANDEPSDGIERVTTSISGFTIDDNRVKYTSQGGADAWDHNRFFNVWITDLGGGYLGYSTFPNSSPAGEDGVVIRYTTLPGNPGVYGMGRTLTHETGHYFYLYHIWGDENGCSGTDFIDDTPNQGTWTSGCFRDSVHTDACSPTAPGVMYQNFMDYTDDACMVMFTLDQKTRMETTINMYRPTMLTSNGADPVILYSLDAAAKSINVPLQRVCSPTFSPVITVRNPGATAITALTIKATLDNGTVSTTNWTGSLASLKETSVTLNAINVGAEGTHTLNVEISSPNGVTDENKANDVITLAFQYYQALTPPYKESFENPTFPPARWDIVNPDKNITWERTTVAAKTGNASVVMRNFDYKANGLKDYLRLPLMNITSGDSAFMTFQLAAAAVTDTGKVNNPFDTLEVLISKDCGAIFTSLYKKGGKNLLTVLKPDSLTYQPKSTEWRKDSVNLTPYINAGQILLAFANTNEHENNVYLDDINVYTYTASDVLKSKGFMIAPNPTTSRFTIQFYPYPTFVKGINVFNSQGQQVASQRLNATGSSGYTFDLTGMASGVYMVQIVLGDGVITRKVIKR
ncbi:MAG: M43 family zinc metalloprotease [Niastella sp.]|uniref:M43 family zinc metalloprotease n=1 Tax=Niastella sp. TaxID=1869183 RepID=UPI00389AA211